MAKGSTRDMPYCKVVERNSATRKGMSSDGVYVFLLLLLLLLLCVVLSSKSVIRFDVCCTVHHCDN